VLVIGSGATAATARPGHRRRLRARHHAAALADLFHPGRNANDAGRQLRALDVDENWIHEIVRRKILFDQDDVHAALRSKSPKR
jgi:hypothetical protein